MSKTLATAARSLSWIFLLACPVSAASSKPTDGGADSPSTRPVVIPDNLPEDLTVWPNRVSFRNSDPWIWQNHDRIRKMRPRVMVLNFANDVEMPAIREHTEKLIRALAEATRYHGFKDPGAPAFLEYEVVKYVDMRDDPIPPERKNRSSSLFPHKRRGPKDFNCDYRAFYGDAFARRYGFPDPRRPGRFLNLHELINSGLVHELWFHAVHIYEEGWPAFEVIELKQYYDEQCRPIPDKHGPAGNGYDDSFPWSGRSFRMAFFNPHRGIGCAMENFGHGLEAYRNSNAIAYFARYFEEFADFNLNKRYKVPFDSLYDVPYDAPEKDWVTYPTPTSMKVRIRGKEYTLDPFIAAGGSVHWAPGARHHYDLDSPFTVKSTIENWRMRNGPDGKDLVLDFNKDKFARYQDLAPDCQGAWMVFWRQCMPGLDNQCVDDDGKPMKNWWPFLFY
ncbi:MAG TPA: hypothetical protein PLC79_09095 [Phycisphaerae bacterium]|nr:hypothetical protein [Phycisphaerae bacterium]